jgi:hypothetical protein
MGAANLVEGARKSTIVRDLEGQDPIGQGLAVPQDNVVQDAYWRKLYEPMTRLKKERKKREMEITAVPFADSVRRIRRIHADSDSGQFCGARKSGNCRDGPRGGPDRHRHVENVGQGRYGNCREGRETGRPVTWCKMPTGESYTNQ